MGSSGLSTCALPAQPGPVLLRDRTASRTKLEDFKWSNPWAARKMKKFDAACEAEKTFRASRIPLGRYLGGASFGAQALQRRAPEDLQGTAVSRQLEWDRPPHGYDRNLLLMEYSDVPLKVKEWIEDQEIHEAAGKGLFAVYPKPVDGTDRVLNTVTFSKPVPAAMRRSTDKARRPIRAGCRLRHLAALDCRRKRMRR